MLSRHTLDLYVWSYIYHISVREEWTHSSNSQSKKETQDWERWKEGMLMGGQWDKMTDWF